MTVFVPVKPRFDAAAAAAGKRAPGAARRVKLIATDVDGTLLDSRHECSPRTLKALKSMPADCTFVIATGKSRGAVVRHLEQVFGANGGWPPSINLNGLITYGPDGRVMKEYTMRPHVAASFAAYAEAKGVEYVVHSGTDLFAPRPQELNAFLKRYNEPEVQVEERIAKRLNSGEVPCNKILFFGAPAEISRLRAAMPEDPEVSNLLVSQDDSASAAPDGEKVYLTSAVASVVEICPAGTSKGVALAALCEKLGVRRDEVVALGDGENDAEMLKWAGTGIVMGNAVPKAVEAADYMTASNDEDGVAVVVETIAREQWM